MLLKNGVKLANVSDTILYALGVADFVWRVCAGTELVVTSLDDSAHSKTSLHYSKNSPDGKCRAFDIRLRGLTQAERRVCFDALRGKLFPLGFDVVDEEDHFHVEYDPKPSRTFAFRSVA